MTKSRKSGGKTAQRSVSISDYYAPFPRQKEFHESKAKYRLFGGAAGPGKTKALLWEAIMQAIENADVDTLLLRRTFPELESSLIAYFRRDVPRELYRSYNESKHVVTWHNNSTTRFGHCAHENDIYQYQGAEYLFIGLDETTHFTLKQWQFLTSRNRCPVRGTFPNMAGATNPGNIGHAWVKALWIDKRAPAGMERAEKYNPADYDFVKATVADNPIYADDVEYRRTLDSLPTHLRRAFLEGDWNVFAGQYFDVFNRARHVVRLAQGNLGARGIAGVRDDGVRGDASEIRDARAYENVNTRAGEPATSAKHSQVENDDAESNSRHPEALRSRGRACRQAGISRSAVCSGGFHHSGEEPGVTASEENPRPELLDGISLPAGRHGLACTPARDDEEKINSGAPSFDCHPEGIRPRMPEGSVCGRHRDVTSGSADDDLSHRSLPAGRHGFVTKNVPQDDNVRAGAGEFVPPPSPAAPSQNKSAGQEPGGTNDASLALVSLEPWWTRWISIDWGFEHPSAVLWHAAAPDGCVVTYREFVQNRLSPRMLAAAIAERCAGERIGATYLSPDAFAQRSADDTIAEQLARGLEMEGLPRPDPADNDRVGGWMLMYEMLREDAWLITRNCAQLIESLPTLTRDEHNIEDVLKCAGDDVADAARYGIKSRLDPRHSPHAGYAEQVMRRGERISAEDPTSRAIWMRQVEAEARRKRGGAPAPRRWRV
jgi:hypothetical protein